MVIVALFITVKIGVQSVTMVNNICAKK